MEKNKSDEAIEKIKGMPLTQVIFIHDYIQLGFDIYGINVYNPMSITQNNATISIGTPTFCDQLVSCIGEKLENVVWGDEKVTLTLENSTELSVSLKDEDYTGPEAVGFYIGETIIVE